MSWLDRLKMGSWNDLEFLVTETESDEGRRIVSHEFPGGDIPLAEDLGRKPVIWRFSAIVHGPDYDIAAAALARELRKEGTGTLVHPQLGARLARILSFRRGDDSRRGRVASFEIVAQEDKFAEFPSPLGDAEKGIGAAADAAEKAGQASAGEGIVAKFVPEFVRTATSSALAAGAKVMRGLRMVRATEAEVLGYQNKITNMIAAATSLAIAPVSLAATVVGAVKSIATVGMSSLDALKCYRGLFGLDDGTNGATSVFGQHADENRRHVAHLFRLAALAGAARAAADVTWGSVDEAEATRAELGVEIDDLQSRADEDVWQALDDLRVQILASIPDRTLQVPEIRTVILPESAPAIDVAYRFLGDANEANAIVDLNRVRDPLLVPGGVELKVADRAAAR